MKNRYKQIDINTFLCMESNITYKVGDVIELRSDLFEDCYRYGKIFLIKSFMITDNPDFSKPNPYKPKRHNNGRVFNFVTATIEAEFEHTIAFEQFTHYIDPEAGPRYQQISTTAFYCLENKQTYKVGDEVTIAPGLWIDNNVYGRTFKIQKFEVVDPIMLKAKHPFTPIREFNGKTFKRVYVIFKDDRIKPGLSWRGMPNEEYKRIHGSIESKRGSTHLSSIMLEGEYPYKFYSDSNFVEGIPGGSKELIEEWNKIKDEHVGKFVQTSPETFYCAERDILLEYLHYFKYIV